MIARLALLLTAMITLGCGGGPAGPPDMGGEDGKQVAVLVEDMNDTGGHPKKIEALFGKVNKPADTKKYGKYNYACLGKPAVSGTTATCMVRIEMLNTGEKAGELEWSFEKDADKWKIKAAPLP